MRSIKKRVIFLLIFIVAFVFTGCKSSNVSSETISKTSISNDELKRLFQEYSPKLDGVYAEGYASKLYDAYKKSNSKQFIEVLSTNELYEMEGIIKLFVSEMFLDGKKGITELEKNYEDIKKQKSLSRKEKYATYEILAQIVYFKESLNYKE